MNKNEFMDLLSKNGYEVILEDNVIKVILVCKNQRELDKKSKEIDNLERESGYKGSLGWKAKLEGDGDNERKIDTDFK